MAFTGKVLPFCLTLTCLQ